MVAAPRSVVPSTTSGETHVPNIFDDDRPEGYDDERDGEARIRPEALKKPEHLHPDHHLAAKAEDVEEAAEHFHQEGQPLSGEQSAP